MESKPKLSQGSILVSEPFSEELYFKRSVILLTEHNTKGTTGFILNKATEVNIDDAVDEFPPFESPLYFGGPINTDDLFYIHTIGLKLPGAKKIVDGIYWGGDYSMLCQMIIERKVKSNMIRFYAGYSGWDPNQLDSEIEERSWMTTAFNQKFTFYDEPKSLWSQVLRSMGNEYAFMANFPEDPTLN